MLANRLREIWRSDPPNDRVVNGWLSIASGFSAEIMAHQGYDSLTVDLQHGMQDFRSALELFQAISTTAVVPLVRVPGLEPALIMKCLDAGAYGVICPLIDNRAQARTLVESCRYPPQGQRSFGPNRVILRAGADYPRLANQHVLAIAMIETRQALENIDEITSTPGLDGIYIGPADLALNLGFEPGFEPTEPALLAAIARICESAVRNGVIPGIHTGSAQYALRMARDGFRLLTVLNDARLLASAARATVEELRTGLAAP